MAHHQAHGDAYFLDQLCLVALSLAFGGICLSLYTWQSSMLHIMLAPFLHAYVLTGGILLVGSAAIRAALLWREAARSAQRRDQHADCEHARDCDHTHHDHDWAPWRYVIVLVPIILFLLGLPNKLPDLHADTVAVDMTDEAIGCASLVATSNQPLSGIVTLGGLHAESADEAAPVIAVHKLEQAAASPATRELWQGELVRVVGRCDATRNPRQFQIERYLRFCCYRDARRVSVNVVCKLPAPTFAPKQWLAVTGRVGFRDSGNRKITVLEVTSRRAIAPTAEESIFED